MEKKHIFFKSHHGAIIDIKVTKNHLYKLKKSHQKSPKSWFRQNIVINYQEQHCQIELPVMMEM